MLKGAKRRADQLTSHPQGGVLKAEAEGWSVLTC
jgi:hypothetical protein